MRRSPGGARGQAAGPPRSRSDYGGDGQKPPVGARCLPTRGPPGCPDGRLVRDPAERASHRGTAADRCDRPHTRRDRSGSLSTGCAAAAVWSEPVVQTGSTCHLPSRSVGRRGTAGCQRRAVPVTGNSPRLGSDDPIRSHHDPRRGHAPRWRPVVGTTVRPCPHGPGRESALPSRVATSGEITQRYIAVILAHIGIPSVYIRYIGNFLYIFGRCC